MEFGSFHDKFPEIAEEETRALFVFEGQDLPPGQYGFLELYCMTPGCDCRRVMFHVFEWSTGQYKAVIAYGWESAAFYARWLHDDDPAVLKELQGPSLNSMSEQSPLAPALLKHARELLSEKEYVDRIKRHYFMYKGAIGGGREEEIRKPAPYAGPKRLRSNRKKK